MTAQLVLGLNRTIMTNPIKTTAYGIEAFEKRNLRTKNMTESRFNRIMKMYEDVCNGLTNQVEFSRRYGITPAQVTIDMKYVWALFNHELNADLDQSRGVAIARLERVILESSAAWERSKKNKEMVKVEYRPVSCRSCKGTGMAGGSPESEEWCEECEGEGEIETEIVTRSTSGQAGDASFLRERTLAIQLLAKIQGVISGTREYHYHDNRNQTQINFDNISPETVLEGKVLMAKMEEEAKDGNRNGQLALSGGGAAGKQQDTDARDGSSAA